MSTITRRDFLKHGAALTGVLAGSRWVQAETAKVKRSATDWVPLGRSRMRVTRLGIGTGTNGGQVQRDMSQEAFTAMIRHAYDRGIRFFDTADNYREMHERLAAALKGIDRESYTIQTKMNWHRDQDVNQTIDRFRKELQTDYFDSFLLHCLMSSNWQEELKPIMDGLEEAKSKQWILTHGASCHGLNALRALPGVSWLDVALLRVNHDGTHMDGPKGDWAEPGLRDEAVAEIRKIHDSGTGVIGMKLIGNGDFAEKSRREESIKFVMGLDCVDAVIIGFKSPAEIDEAIELMDKYLNA
ncbi:MAG TPA: aldo/keto reductase [bacterium]|nr:aldo/keto reductase [bacterium]HOL95579.1 aldo/keto reductase [bacterium]HPO99450.1 aldo/keto reductase [bacterium]HXK94140.1 aldo/keto reductase [bacterium]